MSVNVSAALLAVDGVSPTTVATPASLDELAATLAAANEAGAAVIPWGGGRHMSLGNIPSRYHLALVLNGLDRVLEYEPADLTVTVEAGITFAKLQAALGQHGQFLPIDATPDATVGGVLAANVSGPSRHAYGLPRDWLIGIRVAHADGTVSKGGGRVVKNVAGYDMPKLYVGSLGTLGVIVEATFKVAPLPATQETLIVHCRSLDEAATLAFAADERGLALRAIAVVAGGRLAFWLAGPAAAVERTRRELLEVAGDAVVRRLEGAEADRWWTALVDHEPTDGATVVRADLLPSNVAGFVAQTDTISREAGVTITTVAYPTTGLVQAQLSGPADGVAATIEHTRRIAITEGGSLVIQAAPAEVKQRVDVWGPVEPATFELMQRLKAEFDPKATLKPGRFVGGL